MALPLRGILTILMSNCQGNFKKHLVGHTNVLLEVFELGPDPQPMTSSFPKE